jgi:rubrerythrin
MTATYGQVRDILNVAVEFHRHLKEFYGRLAEQADRDRVQILLDYMSRHEKDFERAMAEYDDKRSKELLDTWMQYTPDQRALEVPRPETWREDMTVDEVVETALDLDEKLVQFYAEAARMARTPEVRHLFEELTEQQQDEREKLKVNASSLKRS